MPEPHHANPGQDELERLRRRRRERERRRRIVNGLPMVRRLAAAHAELRGQTGSGDGRAFDRALVALVGVAANPDAEALETRFGAVAEAAIRTALARREAPDAATLAAARAEVEAAVASQERVRHLATFLAVPVEALVGGLVDASASMPGLDGYRSLSGGRLTGAA
ncbi:MAG TPA: hypothetical protein VFN48_01775 [Solirubrobacteraceae bacterium]|nr:hypothetical protein [Solirubrobacteraceae bacterium]